MNLKTVPRFLFELSDRSIVSPPIVEDICSMALSRSVYPQEGLYELDFYVCPYGVMELIRLLQKIPKALDMIRGYLFENRGASLFSPDCDMMFFCKGDSQPFLISRGPNVISA